jgi:hypothetical protein
MKGTFIQGAGRVHEAGRCTRRGGARGGAGSGDYAYASNS